MRRRMCLMVWVYLTLDHHASQPHWIDLLKVPAVIMLRFLRSLDKETVQVIATLVEREVTSSFVALVASPLELPEILRDIVAPPESLSYQPWNQDPREIHPTPAEYYIVEAPRNHQDLFERDRVMILTKHVTVWFISTTWVKPFKLRVIIAIIPHL